MGKRLAIPAAMFLALAAAASAAHAGGRSAGATPVARTASTTVDGEPSTLACSFKGSASFYTDITTHTPPFTTYVHAHGSGPCAVADNDQGGTTRKFDKAATFDFNGSMVATVNPFPLSGCGGHQQITGGLEVTVGSSTLDWGVYSIFDDPGIDGEVPLSLMTNVEGVGFDQTPTTGNGVFTDHLFGRCSGPPTHPVALTVHAVWANYCPECPLFPTIIPLICSLPVCSSATGDHG
jgi:hypothetical protein